MFKYLEVQTIINVVASLLLEYKVLLIVDGNTTEDMAELIEILLSLIHPIDRRVYTVVPSIYSQRLTALIQKPGNLIASIDVEMWNNYGREIYDTDP